MVQGAIFAGSKVLEWPKYMNLQWILWWSMPCSGQNVGLAAPNRGGTYLGPLQGRRLHRAGFSATLGSRLFSRKLAKGSPRMFEFLKHLLTQLYDPKGLQALVEWGGTTLVCIIVFVETGMFVGFFLPGDSLLVTAGVFAAAGHLKIAELLTLVTLCAIAGDQLGYWIGRKAGENLYRREDSRFFKKRHLERAHEFYEHYGGKTIILARFVPIIRTFCPPVAGAAGMSYPRYLAYDMVGGTLGSGE